MARDEHVILSMTKAPPAGPATVAGMAILKDAMLSIVIAVAAIIGAETLGWAWYILGLLWVGP